MEEPGTIAKPAQSIWEGFDDEERGLFETLAGLIAQEPDWKARKLLFLKIIEKLRDGFARNAQKFGSNLPFMTLLPSHVGALLERLDEPRIESVEQAAFYLLSIHPEHQAAAESWLASDRQGQKDFVRFVNANSFYAALYRSHEHYHGDQPDGF